MLSKDFGNRSSLYRMLGKRFFDVLLSGGALLALSPALAAIAVLVRIQHGSPIFFTPTRPGKDEKIFRLYKFRTMTDARDRDGVLLPEADRITKLGKFLRATSLDEIPELYNIFKGDMSIVGPRPFAMKNLPYYYDEERERHSVRPGLTGLAQISGRNNLPWPQRFDKDLEYISNLSLKEDLTIIYKTVSKLFGDSDVTIPNAEKMPQFDTYRIMQEECPLPDPDAHTGICEIGSFFHLAPNSDPIESRQEPWLPALFDSSYTFSGRAAIHLAVLDAMKKREIKTAYLPSYLPFSALQPFIQMGIRYSFYDVDWKDGKIVYRFDKRNKDDLFLFIDYFGKTDSSVESYARRVKEKGGIVIRDVTHSLFNRRENEYSDYVVASLRKWIAAPSGGWLSKNSGELLIKPNLDGDEAASVMRKAMQSKYEFIFGLGGDREQYLRDYADFESSLVQLSPMLQIDTLSKRIIESADLEELKSVRKRNAAFLYDQLSGNSKLSFLNNREELDAVTPLFLPVLLAPDDRRSLRDYLVKKGFYCPTHWPERMGAALGFRRKEISLPCDQRYTLTEMNDLVNAINTWSKAQI